MIKLHEIHKVYMQGKVGFHALKNISLYFEKGEIVAIYGPSGCGKTTLLNIIGTLKRILFNFIRIATGSRDSPPTMQGI